MGTQKAPRPLTLVVGVDFSDLSAQALRVAHSLAARMQPSRIHAVHVAIGDASADLAPIPVADILREEKKRLDDFVKRSGIDGEIVTHAVVGAPAEALAAVAKDQGADVVVLGTHGRKGISRMLFGSVAESVVRGAPCSVLVVRERELTAEELIQPARPGQDMHEHHARATTHHESPNAASSNYGMGALTFRG